MFGKYKRLQQRIKMLENIIVKLPSYKKYYTEPTFIHANYCAMNGRWEILETEARDNKLVDYLFEKHRQGQLNQLMFLTYINPLNNMEVIAYTDETVAEVIEYLRIKHKKE